MDHCLQLIGIARKAGLLAVGSEAVKSSVRAGKASLVVTATDASEGSTKRARYSSESSGVIYVDVPYTKFEIGNITGRGSPGTVAILDIGLAAGFMRKLAAKEPERYGEAAELMEEKSRRRAEKGVSRRRIEV